MEAGWSANPWSEFGSAVAFWLDAPDPLASGSVVSSTVPMCYRVVAMRGDHMASDVSRGPGASACPATDMHVDTAARFQLVPGGMLR